MGLRVDTARYSVFVDGKEILLTSVEFRILSHLYDSRGRVVSYNELLRVVWGNEWIGEIHLIQVNICRLRKKIGDSAREQNYILKRHGGYMLERFE